MPMILVRGQPLAVLTIGERPTPTDTTARFVTSDLIGTYDSDVCVGFVITPYEDITFSEWAVIAGREYTASASNNDGYIDLAKIYEYTGSSTNVLANYNTVSVYGRNASSSGELGWYDKNFSGTGNNDRGLHKKYGELITGYDRNMFKYKMKLTSGNSITLHAGYTYYFGLLPGCRNGSDYETAGIVLNDIVAKTNDKNYFASHTFNSTTLTKRGNHNYLPYIEFDGVPFDKFQGVNYGQAGKVDSIVLAGS